MNWNFTLVDARGQGWGGGGDLGFSGNIVSVQSENLGRWVKDEIAEVANEIENLGSTEER